MKIAKTIYVSNRDDWRAWLEKHHNTEKEIWLIFYKKRTRIPCVAYNDAVEEAICFGWIDGIRKKIDEERFAHKFTPRKENSVWSEINVRRAEKMMKLGKMTEAGLAKIQAAKRNGKFFEPYGGKKKLDIPNDLKEALLKNITARDNFDKFAISYRNTYLRWLDRAKTEETRKNRIAKIVKFAEENKKEMWRKESDQRKMVKLIKTTAKRIYTKTCIPGCDYVINHYVGCEHNCAYCYVKFMYRWKPKFYGKWGEWVEAKMNAPEMVAEKFVEGNVTFFAFFQIHINQLKKN